jgi:hypothetical protein
MSAPRLRLHSEPFSRSGGIGDGLRKLLGQPTISLTETVVREAVQNACDAAKLQAGPEILIRLRTLSPSQAAALRTRVLAELPEHPASRAPLERFLNAPEPRVLEICDFGTTGLRGPTRADYLPPDAGDLDFINFLRNIGAERDTHHGGGTYGFGKVALYLASACRTIVVDTLTDQGGCDARRFMGCHLGGSFGEPQRTGGVRRFTGRHWWGLRGEDAEDPFVDPMIGAPAAALAAALGMPDRIGARIGTSIMILDPVSEISEGDDCGGRIAETLLWNFWPRMMESVGANRRLRCTLQIEDEIYDLPQPEQFPPLNLFCEAIDEVRGRKGRSKALHCLRPHRLLGRIAVAKGLRSPRRMLVAEDSLFPTNASHIAVMRPVELVVRYFEGPPLPDPRAEWAGVFIADDDDDTEQAFARSEPPAHDDWAWQGMEKGPAKTFVKRACELIREEANAVAAAPMASATGGEDGPSLAKIAGRMGALLSGSREGAGARTPGVGVAGAARSVRATRPVFLALESVNGRPVAVFQTKVTQDAAGSGVALVATPALAIDGASLRGTAEGIGLAPTVLSIRSADRGMEAPGPRLGIHGAAGLFEIRVAMPGETAVTVEVAVDLGAAS